MSADDLRPLPSKRPFREPFTPEQITELEAIVRRVVLAMVAEREPPIRSASGSYP